MIIQAELKCKQTGCEAEPCAVDKVIELPSPQFQQFSRALLADYDFIAENKNAIRRDDDSRHCLLILDAEGTDGFLVDPQGYNYARYSAFNRKEKKDHGEGGNLVGAKIQEGDRIAIVEDVVTAGTAVRETIALFQTIAPVKINALFVSVDRMEKGTGEKSALDELRDEYGIAVYPIVTVRQIIDFLHNRPIDGKVYIDDAMRERMEAYLRQYGATA